MWGASIRLENKDQQKGKKERERKTLEGVRKKERIERERWGGGGNGTDRHTTGTERKGIWREEWLVTWERTMKHIDEDRYRILAKIVC